MRRFSCFGLFFTLAFLANCGGKGNPGGPTDNTFNATLRMISLRDGQPVAGAVVSTQAGDMQSQADGTVRLTGIRPGTVATVTAGGFLAPHRFPVKGDAEVGLWPADARLPEDFTLKAYYGNDTTGRLYRPSGGGGVVLATRDILGVSRAHRALLDGVNEVNNAARDMQLSVAEYSGTTPSGYYIHMLVDPNDRYIKELGAAAVTYNNFTGNGVIANAKIVFNKLEYLPGLHLQRAMSHEMGHGLGLSHTEGYIGMMWGAEPVIRFSSREREVLNYAFRRPPGNRWPDDSTGLSASRSTTKVLVCALDESGNPID